MKPANFYLNDLLDLDAPECIGDTLWRAMRPTSARVDASGTAFFDIPFAPFSPETNPVSKPHTLAVRAYGERVLRISLGEVRGTDDVLFQWDDSLSAEPLTLHHTPEAYELRDTRGLCRMRVALSDTAVVSWSDLVPAPAAVFEATFFPDGQVTVPLAARDAFTPMLTQTGSLGLAYVEREGQPHRWTWSLAARHDEHFAGTGERFARMDLAGGTYVLENTDALGVNSLRAYKNVPFYTSSAGYGLLALTSSHVRLSLAGISTRAACGVVEEASLDLFLFGGTPERIVYEYRRVTGFPAQPPPWSYGTWMAKMTYFSAAEVAAVGRRMREGGFPCDVLHLDTGWFSKDWKCEWEFSAERFPDPRAFFADMRQMGFRVSLWQLPGIARGTKHWEEASIKNYVAPKIAGDVGGSNFGTGADDGATIDFTNPEAVTWYQGLLAELLEMGAAAIKTDFGELIDMNAAYQAMPAARLHNLYALLYQKAAFEVTQRITGDSIIWARAGWTGCQRYPLHWGGDAAATWDGLAGSVRGGLHIGVSGFGFWSHDVPGFHGVPDFMNSRPSDELYVRWTQFGVFSSHLRYHGTSAREPYEYPAVADIVRRWLRLRYALIPYLLDQAEIVAKSGFPILRAMIFHHPQDPTCWKIDDQFFCGDALLIAPLLDTGGIRDVYLPEGEWLDFWTGEKFTGPRWLRAVKSPLDRLPVFARFGAVIRIYPDPVQHTGEMNFSRSKTITFNGSFAGWEI